MGLGCFKSVDLLDVTNTVRLYYIISDEYDYLKPRRTIAMEYDAEMESYLLRILLETFLKETIDLDSKHSITATVGSRSSSYLSDSGYDFSSGSSIDQTD